MLLAQMKRERFACKSFVVIPILLSAISILPITWTATTQPSSVGMPSHHIGVGNQQLVPTAGNVPFAIQTSQNIQPNPSPSSATVPPQLVNAANSSKFTTTTTATPSVAATSSRPAISPPTLPAAIFNVSPSSTTTTSRPVALSATATTAAPVSTSTTMISTTTSPTTTTTTTTFSTTVGTTPAPSFEEEVAPAFSNGPDSPSIPTSPRSHHQNMELPNLDSEPQPNIPNLQRQNFDESTQNIPTSSNNNNNNDFAMETRDNPFDSLPPSPTTTTTTTTPPPSSTTITSTTTTTPQPLPAQNSSLSEVTNSTAGASSNEQSNDQSASSSQSTANSTTNNIQLPSDFKRIPDNRSRAENPNNNKTSASNGASTTAAKVQILKPRIKFKCSNHTDCKNNGYCINGSCFCSPGFTGESCDVNIDECRQFGGQPCLNNGTCVDDINAFHCECPVGFRGERCQDVADMCSESPCYNNAKCINHMTHFTCNCEPGWAGERCEIDIDDCAKNPCQNNATCHDQINSYRCDCLSGFMGANCEININDCAPNPCQNNATCHDLINDYECECPAGFMGKICDENIDDCATKPCLHGFCVDLVGDFECNCEDGWTGKQCEHDINECETGNGNGRPVCLNGGTCQNLQPSYQCLCRDGYGGRNCGEIVDYCKAKQPCGKHGSCKNTNTVKGLYQCECQSSHFGSKCERKRDCLNECHNHHAHCVNNVTCACLPGRREERIMCEYVSSCQQVEGELCLNGGYCKNLETGGYQCTCQEPFYGPICQFAAERPQFDAFLFVVITCVGLLVVACAVVSLVLFRSVRKARATRGTYSPSTQEKHGNSASDLLKQPVPERLI